MSRFLTRSPAPGRASRDASLPGATPATALRRFVAGTFRYSGRASRAEYWWPAAATSAVALVLEAPGLVRTVADVRARRGTEDPAGVERNSPVRDHVEEVPAPEQDRPWSWPLSPATAAFGAIVCPGIVALTVRRLHDTNRSGW